MIIKTIKKLFNQYIIKKLEQYEYELKEEIKSLEISFEKTQDNIVWDKLQMKREEHFNVLYNLDKKRQTT